MNDTAPTRELVAKLEAENAELKQRVQQLAERERHLRAVLDTEPECVKSLASDGTLLEINRAGLAMIEADSSEQVIGLCIYPLVVEEHRVAFQALTERVFRGQSGSLEFEIVGLKEGRRWVETQATPLRGESGEVLSLLSVTRDITERKQMETALREAKRKLDSTINSLSGFVFRCANHPDWPTEYLSEGVRDLLGYPAEEFTSGKRTPASLIEPADRGRMWKEMQTAIEARRPYVTEYRIQNAAGEEKWMWEKGAGVFEGDTLLALEGFVTDITDRKRAEESLRESEERLRLALGAAQMGAWSWDIETHQTTYSAELGPLFGLAVGAGVSSRDTFLNRIHPEDRPRFDATIRCVLEHDEPYSIDYRVVWPDHSIHWLASRGQVKRDDAGAPLKVVGVVMDITEREEAAIALRKSEELLAYSQSQAKIGSWQYSFATQTANWSAEMFRLHGRDLSHGPMTIAEIFDSVHPDDRQSFETAYADALAKRSGNHLDYRVVRPDGSIFWAASHWEMIFDDMGQFVGLTGTLQDITDRKTAEFALRESDLRLRMAVSAANVGLWDWDLTTNKVYFSPEWKRQIGYDEHEVSNEFSEWQSRVHPDDLERTLETVRRYIANPRPNYVTEFRLRHKDGSYRWILTEASLQFGDDGRPVRMLGSHVDITERHQVEARLHESNRRFATVFRASPVGNCITRFADGVFLNLNEAFAKITGHTRDEMLGRSSLELNYWVDPGDRAMLVQALADNGFVRDWEVGFRRKDGSLGHSLRSLERLTLDGEDCILTVLSDITDRKRNEEELRISGERLEVLSRQLIATQESERRHLARELHDEIGQELTSIKLNLKNLQQVSPNGADLVLDTLAIAEHALQQVRSLALDLRPSMLDDIGLAPALRWCLDRQAHRSGFAPHFLAEPPELAASPEVAITCFRVAQESLTNIARHAQARTVRMEVRQYETALDLQVHDDGIGFDVNAATERATQGASLGLLGMRERAELVGGLIDIESTPNSGTTIHARFPLRSE